MPQCMWAPSLFIRDKEEPVLVGCVAGLVPKAWLCAYQLDYSLYCPLNSAHPAEALSLGLADLWGKIYPLLRTAYVRRESGGINLDLVSVLTKRRVSICLCRFGCCRGALSQGMLLNMQGEPCWCQGIQRGKTCLNGVFCLHCCSLGPGLLCCSWGGCLCLAVRLNWWLSVNAYGNGSRLLCPTSWTSSMGRECCLLGDTTSQFLCPAGISGWFWHFLHGFELKNIIFGVGS